MGTLTDEMKVAVQNAADHREMILGYAQQDAHTTVSEAGSLGIYYDGIDPNPHRSWFQSWVNFGDAKWDDWDTYRGEYKNALRRAARVVGEQLDPLTDSVEHADEVTEAAIEAIFPD